VIVRRGKPTAISAQKPPDEVVSRKGQPASIARPEAGAGGQMMLMPEEPAAAPAKPKTRAKVEAVPSAAAVEPAVAQKPSAAPKSTAKTKATPPAAVEKPAAKESTEAQAPVKPKGTRSKRTPEAEFEPKPKSAGTQKPDTPEALRTAWAPSPPRTPDEPEDKPPKGKK
jgi:hypothetical protein